MSSIKRLVNRQDMEGCMEELRDLKKIYEERLGEIKEKVDNYHWYMVPYMKALVELDKEREEIRGKMDNLKEKMGDEDGE